MDRIAHLVAFSAVIAIMVFAQGCATGSKPTGASQPPAAPREFRAVWVATVGNIDWPSKPGLSSEQQKTEALAILDRCKDLNINAIVLQVRPSCDAFYESKLEPWSYYLTGEQGKPPETFYDPLKFWIEESHRRGMELHAWFNPYRARAAAAKYATATNHVSKTKPSIVKEFNGWEWLDPAEPEAMQQTYDVFLDVAKRYDVDGIHIDDYFYPYPSYISGSDKGPKGDFPDEASWSRYTAAGGKLARADWRRENVNTLIEKIYSGIKQTKPHVKFGISPFGIGKPAQLPKGITGFSQYDELYADADLWFNEGWLDYFTPQLYWAIDKQGQQFPVLVDYWISQNKKGRHFWPGLYTSRFSPPRKPATEPATTPSTQPAPNPNEIVDQIDILRGKGDQATGHVHFSMIALMRNQKLADQIKEQNAMPALVPASPWLGDKAPAKPRAKLTMSGGDYAALSIDPRSGQQPQWLAVWKRFGDDWSFEVCDGRSSYFNFPASRDGKRLTAVCVSAVDRIGNESGRVMLTP